MINLNVHSCFDFLNSNIRIEDLIQKVAEDGQSAVALTDFNRMHGIYRFMQSAVKNEVKPLTGMEIRASDGVEGARLVLIAKNDKGFRELIRLSAMLSYKDITETPLDYLTENINHCVVIAKDEAGIPVLDTLNIPDEDKYQSHTIRNNVYNRLFFQTSFYLSETDLPAVKALNAIRDNERIEIDNISGGSGQYFVKTFKDLTEEEGKILDNNRNLLSKCDVSIPRSENILPRFPNDQGMDSKEYLWHLLKRNLDQTAGAKYMERLEYEYNIIIEMGYEDYFLIVQDAVNFAKKSGIYVGPGRGSSSASLVSYLLNITEVDPLKYNLLFERFLNPERVSMPDIDIDFEDTRRDEIVDYLMEKYGTMNVSHIITYGTLSAKMAARDVGRVVGFSEEELKLISNMIPETPGAALKDVFKSDRFKSLAAADDKYRAFAEISIKVEGLPRHSSTHAAGVLLSENNLTKVVPVIFQEGHALSQWTMTEVESAGLLKIDILGLRNLSLIRYMVNRIRKVDSGFDYREIPEDNPAVYKLLSKGLTLGVFQLESEGIRRVVQDVNPDTFMDLASVIALYRPGPMKEIPHFIDGKENPESVSYPHPELKEILKETYGVIVYQEQIMQIASKIAGYSYANADILRRAMSKKDRRTLEKERMNFEKGAEQKGYGRELGKSIFDLIMEFADYGFAKSHAVAYSRISYILGFIKAMYPVIFYSVILTHHFGSDVKIRQVMDEIRLMRINILPPDINRSEWANISKESIGLGFSMIKGVTYRTAAAIIEERKNGAFKDIYDLKTRVKEVNLNRKVLSSLIISGALDSFKENRKTMLQSLPLVDALNTEEYAHDSFLSTLGFSVKKEFNHTEEMGSFEMIEGEKEVLGFYISEHPIRQKHKELQYIPFSLLSQKKRNASYLLFFESIKTIKTKKGQNMAFARVSDGFEEMEAVIFPKTFFNVHHLLSEKVLVVSGRTEERKGERQLIADNIETLASFKDAYMKTAKQVFIRNTGTYELSGFLSDEGMPVLDFDTREEIGKILHKDIYTLINAVKSHDIRILQ